jgi:hypothetical protein
MTWPTSRQFPRGTAEGAQSWGVIMIGTSKVPPPPVGRYRPGADSSRHRSHRRCGYRPGGSGTSGHPRRSANPAALIQNVMHLTTSLFKVLIWPVLATVVALVMVGFFVPTQTVKNATAYAFFANYYGRVTQASQRQMLYWNDLTSSFRSRYSWSSYTGWWQTQKSVTVLSVIQVPGNALEFRVSLIFHPLTGGTSEETDRLWFACKGLLGGLRSRVSLFGCPLDDLEIDNQQEISVG